MVSLLNFLRILLAPVAILLTAAIMVVIYGPDIGMKRPWNFVVAGFFVLLAVGAFVVFWIVEKRKERKFEDEFSKQADAESAKVPVAKRAETEALVARWKEQVRLLRESRRGRPVLSTLPWFMIIGESGSGKGTLLLNSGLDFPVGDAKIAGIGGTKNCDWWFANEAIILDTAGRYAFEVQNAPDRLEWERFLSLLKKLRKRTPINGLIVAVPTDSLLEKSEDELRSYAQHLRGKINDTMTRLGAVFPVYLVITKSDKVEGFVDFFKQYPAERVREVVGRTFVDARPANCFEGASKTLDDLYDRLCSMSLGFMERNEPGESNHALLTFPEEFRSLVSQLKVLIEALFRPNLYMRNPVFRGLYITSGTQEGRTISKAFGETARNLGISLDQLTSEFTDETVKRPFFVRDLWSKVIVEDGARNLVRPLALGARGEMTAALGKVVLPTVLVVSVLLLWSFLSAAASKTQWRELTKQVDVSHPILDKTETLRPETIPSDIASLNKLADLHRRAAERSSILNLGLTRNDPDAPTFEKRFREATETYVLGPTLARHKSVVEGTPGAPAAYVKALAAYLSYAAAAQSKGAADEARLGELADVWASDQRMGVYAHKSDLAQLVGSYLAMGGRYDGGIDWGRAARSVQELADRYRETDPLIQLRRVATDSKSLVESPNSPGLKSASARIKTIVDAGEIGKDLPAGVFERMAKDLEKIPGGTVVKVPLTGLANVLEKSAKGGTGAQAAYVEKIGKPLQEVLATPLPGACPPVDAANAGSADAVVAAIQAFNSQLEEKAKPLREGIAALDQSLAPADQIDGGVVADIIRLAKVDEFYAACSAGWFDSSGPLDRDTLRRVACPPAPGGGGGGGGKIEYVGPPGQGLFQCTYPMPSAGGNAQPACPMAAAVQTFGSGLVGKISTAPCIAGDRKGDLRGSWESVAGFLASLASPGGGGGPGGLNGNAAIDRIELAESVANVSLEALPERLRGASSLADIVAKIKSSDPNASGRLRTFRSDNYVAALDAIAQRLERAQKDPTGLALVGLATELVGPESKIDDARSAAMSAPTVSLRQGMTRVVDAVQRTILEGASTSLASYWSNTLRGSIDELRGCYPIAEGASAECDINQFTEIFGPDKAIARLKGLAHESPAQDGLAVGPEFRSFIRAAARIQRAYGAGAADDAKFVLVVQAESPVIRGENGNRLDRDTVVDNGSLTLASGQIRFEKTGSVVPGTMEITLDEGSQSKLNFLLHPNKETRQWVSGPPKEFRGPWSFMRMLDAMKKDADVYSMEIPAWDKDDRKKRPVATIVLSFRVTGKANSPSVVQPGFWTLPNPPATVRD